MTRRRMLAGCECSGMVRDAFARLGWEAWSCDTEPSETPVLGTMKSSGELVVTAQGEREGLGYHYQGDVRDLFDPMHPVNGERWLLNWADGTALWDIGAFFPPCTHLSQAGAVWWKHKDATRGGDGRMQEGARFFMQMVEEGGKACARSAVENPVGVMGLPSQACYYRRPDQVVQPYMFGDPHKKATCLWLNGLPLLVADNPVEWKYRVATGGGSWRTDQGNGRGANNKYEGGVGEDAKGRVNRQRERNRTLPGFARAMASQWTAFTEAQEAAA